MHLKNNGGSEISEPLLRHMILNGIRNNFKKFKEEYGPEMIIACDDRLSWRKDIFPYYKASRAKSKEKIMPFDFDWNIFYDTLNKVKNELKEFFPYVVIQVEKCEADDVIGTIVHENGLLLGNDYKLLIISRDSDFLQLQIYSNVKQYDPIGKKWLETKNALHNLREHIIRGDTKPGGDGIPNFMSEDNSLVLGKRQKSIMTKKVEEWVKHGKEQFDDDFLIRNWERNDMLINLSRTPQELKAKILDELKSQKENPIDGSRIMSYFMKNKLMELLENINDFV